MFCILDHLTFKLHLMVSCFALTNTRASVFLFIPLNGFYTKPTTLIAHRMAFTFVFAELAL